MPISTTDGEQIPTASRLFNLGHPLRSPVPSFPFECEGVQLRPPDGCSGGRDPRPRASRQPLPSGSPEEVELRACAVAVGERLTRLANHRFCAADLVPGLFRRRFRQELAGRQSTVMVMDGWVGIGSTPRCSKRSGGLVGGGQKGH